LCQIVTTRFLTRRQSWLRVQPTPLRDTTYLFILGLRSLL